MKKSCCCLCSCFHHHHHISITKLIFLLSILTKQYVSASIESRFESSISTNTNSNNEKGKEFWPSFDDPLPNQVHSAQQTVNSILLTTLVQITTTQSSTTGQQSMSTSTSYQNMQPTTIPYFYNNLQQQTTYRKVEVIGDGNYRYPYPNDNQPMSNKLSEKKITDTSETYYQRQPAQNGSSYFYNMIILVLGAIGGASFLAIIVGFVLIVRSRAFCFCKGQQTSTSQDHINNNNNTDNNSQNPDTFSSTAMIASYLNRKSRSIGNIQGASELVTSIQQQQSQSPVECSQISLIKQDTPIRNPNLFDSSEQSSTTSKLTRSGVMNITHSESCSPYAAIQIADIKAYGITPVENKISNIENIEPGEQILKVTLPDIQTDNNNKTPDSDSANVSKETNEFPILRSDFGSSTTNIQTPTILETTSIASPSTSSFNMETMRKPQLNPLQQQQQQQSTSFYSYRVDKPKPSSVLPTNAYSYRVQKSNSIQDDVNNTSSLFNFDKQNTINE